MAKKDILITLATIISINLYTLCEAATPKNVAGKDKCIVQRAMFELGSGVTSIALATVNKCTETLVNLQKQTQKKITFQDDINLSRDKATLSSDIINDGIEKIEAAKKELGINCDAIECAGIATAAMRNAKNASEALKKIYKKTNVNVTVVSQNEEGLLGYYSAMIKAKLSKTEQANAMVLDVGGGSYQVIYTDRNERLVYGGLIGSAIFKTMVIELVKGYNLKDTNTPNPMTAKEVDRAELLSTKSIGEPITGVEAVKKLLQKPNMKIYGIGSFLKAIAKLCRKETGNKDALVIDMASLTKLIDSFTLKSDDYIKQSLKDFPYFSELETNLVFVYGIMKALNITALPIIDTNNTPGALILPQYW